MDMQMTFSSALPINILFESWVVNTNSDYAWSFAVVVCMGFARQLFASVRHDCIAVNCAKKSKSSDESRLLDDDSHTLTGGSSTWLRPRLASAFLRRNQAVLRLLDIFLFGCTLVTSYLNMLVVMTYNPGLMMAIVIGEMIGLAVLQPMGGFTLATGTQEAEEEGCCH